MIWQFDFVAHRLPRCAGHLDINTRTAVPMTLLTEAGRIPTMDGNLRAVRSILPISFLRTSTCGANLDTVEKIA